MRIADSVLLTCWPAGAARAHGVDLEVGLVDDEIRFLREGQDRDGRGGGVDAPLRFGRRHALDPMHAALELEPGEHAAAGNLGDDFLVAAGRPLAHRQHLDLPALRLRIFDIHAEEIAGEESRFVAAGPGAHLENRVALVGRVLRQQRDADRLRHLLGLGLGGGEFGARHRAHLGVEIGIPQHGGEIRPLLLLGAPGRRSPKRPARDR